MLLAAGGESKAELGKPDTILCTTESMGASPPAGAVLVGFALGAEAQLPSIPMPRMSQTTEFKTDVIVGAGALGSADVACSTTELTPSDTVRDDTGTVSMID